MIRNILFDLDGTLLPMDIDAFVKQYFTAAAKHFNTLGYSQDIILNGLMSGTKAMMKNDGSHTNETAFWLTFSKITGYAREEMEPHFLTFYQTIFPTLQPQDCQHEIMQKAITLLKEKGYTLFLTTNPLFPQIAVEERLRWCNGTISDFQAMTSFETSHYAKPNPAYFEEFLNVHHLDKKECLMVGNDPLEDGVIETLGIPLYLIEDYKITREKETPTTYSGSSNDFYQFVCDLPSISKE